MLVWAGEKQFEFNGKKYHYIGDISRISNGAHGYGEAKCIDDPTQTITGYFAGNKPNGVCKLLWLQ